MNRNRAEECAGEGVQQVTEVVRPFQPRVTESRLVDLNSASADSVLWFHSSMLRLVGVTRLRSSDFASLSLRIHQRAFTCTDPHKMANESTGTHKDPVTGEMISKQYVLIQIRFSCAHRSLCVGNSSAAKSSAKKRQGGRRMLWLSLRRQPMTALGTMLQTKIAFRLM